MNRISSQKQGSAATLFGSPGAVTPARAALQLIGFNTANEALFDTSTDGSFSTPAPGTTTEAYRLQAQIGTEFSPPVDFVIPASAGAVQPYTRPFAPCLSTIPELEYIFSTVTVGSPAVPGIVVLRNQCSEDITVDHYALLKYSQGFEGGSTPPSPFVVAASSESQIEVKFKPKTAGFHRDHLYIVLSGSETGRILVTLRGESQ